MKSTVIVQNPVSLAFQNITNDIKLLTFINDFAPKASQTRIRQYKRKLIKAFNARYPEEEAGFSKLTKFFAEAEKISGGKDFVRLVVEGKRVGEVLGFMIDFHNLTIKAPEFIREMSIVYLVTRFEEFLAEVLRSYFLKDLNL